MPDTNLTSAKIVSAPKLDSWSQVYNAGKLFVVLSLEKEIVNIESPDALNILGKDLLAKLEEEFFTLNYKHIDSIKKAFSSTFANIQNDINYSFAACFFVNNTLYLLTIGKGTAFIKRGSKMAKSFPDGYPKTIASFSGVSKNNDLIILTTTPLPDIITNEAFSFLDNLTPNEIKTALMPKIQEKEDGNMSAIIIRYSEVKPQEIPVAVKEKKTKEFKNYVSLLKKYLPIKNIKINHQSKVMLTLAIIILTIFISTVYFGIKKQETSKVKALFAKTYPEADKKYSQGNSLLDLNKNLAQQNFVEAKKILEEGKSKFAKNSKEEEQILDLLKKVNDALASSSGINLVKAKPVDSQSSNFLLLQIQSQADQFTQDHNNIYFIDDNAVSLQKAKGKITVIIKNKDYWKEAGGIAVYLGNIYVLDKKQILKFVLTGTGYSKTNYFAQDLNPDFSKASSMAIDSSIYVLLTDGTIKKFTRGKEDRFAVSSLDKPFSSPSRIFTNVDTNNLYILDNGNSRIVVLNKEGIYQSQYQADVLKGAKDFEVKESDKKIFILSNNKVYGIGM